MRQRRTREHVRAAAMSLSPEQPLCTLPASRRELALGLAPLKGLKPPVGEAGLPALTPFCWKGIEHPPGVSLSYSRAPAGLQQKDMLQKKKKKKADVEISAPQPILLVLRLWQAALRFLIKPLRMEDEMAPAIKTQPRL